MFPYGELLSLLAVIGVEVGYPKFAKFIGLAGEADLPQPRLAKSTDGGRTPPEVLPTVVGWGGFNKLLELTADP